MKLITQNQANFGEDPLTGEEMQTFDAQWNEFFVPPWSLERQLINLKKTTAVVPGCAASKNIFKRKFNGFNPQGGEFGMHQIRPGHVGLVGDGTYAEGNNSWIWNLLTSTTTPGYATGYNGWIHSPSSATSAYNLPEGLNVLPFYLVEESPTPILQTIKLDINRANILAIDVNSGHLRDPKAPNVAIYMLPVTFWVEETSVNVSIQTKKAGYMDLRLGGFTFGTTEMLDAYTYTAATHTVTATKTAAT